jgi:glycerophosphoryl diester phosphodiesterase
VLHRALAIATTTAATVAALLVTTGTSEAATSRPCSVAAHRGDHSHWVENSVMATRAAVHDGADYVEMDVQVTKDGHFVLMHDRTVDRTTRGGATGTVTGKTYAQIRAMRLNDGHWVPTLASVLKELGPSGPKALVELKWIPTSRWPALVRRIEAFGAKRVVVNSFSRNVMSRFHARYPRLRTALDTDRVVSLTDAKAFGGVMLDGRRTTAHWRSVMHAHGVPVFLWAADRVSTWRAWSGQATAVITNNPRGYVAYRRSACRGS